MCRCLLGDSKQETQIVSAIAINRILKINENGLCGWTSRRLETRTIIFRIQNPRATIVNSVGVHFVSILFESANRISCECVISKSDRLYAFAGPIYCIAEDKFLCATNEHTNECIATSCYALEKWESYLCMQFWKIQPRDSQIMICMCVLRERACVLRMLLTRNDNKNS